MKLYIEELEYKLNNTMNWNDEIEIMDLLKEEKDSCYRILDEYSKREERAWLRCSAICDHEREIADKITKIIYNYLIK